MSNRLFKLGRTLATPGALEALDNSSQNPLEFLDRHQSGDWGDICQEDSGLNNRAVKEGFRVLSAYSTSAGEKIWIITEADRSATTILLPEEY